MKKIKEFQYNRAETKDRPQTTEGCRKNTNKLCKQKGHDYRFQRFDRYAYCAVCGDEILT